MLDLSLSIGQRFKTIRTEKGFSQAELVDGICSQAVVSQIETDRKYPSAEMWGKLADRLGVPLREIMGMQEQQMEAGFQIEMIRVYIEKGDYCHALELIESLDCRDDLLEHQRVELIILLSDCYIKSAHYNKAVDLLHDFIERQEAQKTINDETLCNAYNKLGNAHYERNDFERAYSAFEQGYRVSLKLLTFDLVAARVTKNLGLTCNQLGYKDEGRRYLEKAYTFYESVEDIPGVANTLFALAMSTGEVEYLTRAKSLYESINLIHEANVVKQHYAFHVESKRNYKNSLSEFDESVSAFEELGDVGMCLYTSSRAAMVCIYHEDIEKAKGYLVKAEEFRTQIEQENEYLYADFYRAKAMYHLHVKNYEQCILNSDKSSQMCDNIGLRAESAISLQLSVDAYHLLGMHDKSYLASKRVFELLHPYGGRSV